MAQASRLGEDLNLTSPYSYRYHDHSPSQRLSAQEAEVSQQHEATEDQPHSPVTVVRKPLSPLAHSTSSNNEDPTQSSSTDPKFDDPTQTDYSYASPIPNRVHHLSPIADGLEVSQSYLAHTERAGSGATAEAVTSPGLESIWSGEADKEVYSRIGTPSGYSNTSHPSTEARKTERICGVRRKWFFFLAALITCIIVAVAVALGVVFGTRHSSSKTPAAANSSTPLPSPSPTTPANIGDPAYDIGGYLNPLYYSTSAAFNGSGIALTTQTYNENGYGVLNMYFQHYDGSIRYMRLQDDGSWVGGDPTSVVADDAKNGTVLAAVAYVMNDTATWHLFYVNVNDTVEQKTYTNLTNYWEPGPLNNLNVSANNNSAVGLQACWFGNLYGDSDYTNSPQFSPNISTTVGSDGSGVGMHLFVGDSDTSFQQYGWLHGEDDWTRQEHWPNKNGRGGVGCYSWGPGTVSYVFMLDLNDNLNIYWKDTNSSLQSNSTHPINVWTNSSITIPGLHPSSSLGFTDYLYCQLADETINGYNISFDAESTAFIDASTSDLTDLSSASSFQVDGQPGVPGTHLSVTSITDSSGGANILAFYQVSGNDVTEYTRDIDVGQWTGAAVPIPP